jgi:SAM-dependent methyltransferase
VQFRPQYPASQVQFLTERIVAAPGAPDLPVLDVGSGTGIFTRQLAAALPGAIQVIGIEPSAKMRETAEADRSREPIIYRDGTAEHLPLGNAAARAVVAATAAHWFDREAFYLEARRVLVAGGILAIVEYVRDEASSAAARAVVEFLAEHGEDRAYVRPDYVTELSGLCGFGPVEMFQEPVTLSLGLPQFVGLALSSSHARHAIEKLGAEAADRTLRNIGIRLAGNDGRVPFGYLFQAFLTAHR